MALVWFRRRAHKKRPDVLDHLLLDRRHAPDPALGIPDSLEAEKDRAIAQLKMDKLKRGARGSRAIEDVPFSIGIRARGPRAPRLTRLLPNVIKALALRDRGRQLPALLIPDSCHCGRPEILLEYQ